MRASVLAHLPALVLTRRAKTVMKGAAALGLPQASDANEGAGYAGGIMSAALDGAQSAQILLAGEPSCPV